MESGSPFRRVLAVGINRIVRTSSAILRPRTSRVPSSLRCCRACFERPLAVPPGPT